MRMSNWDVKLKGMSNWDVKLKGMSNLGVKPRRMSNWRDRGFLHVVVFSFRRHDEMGSEAGTPHGRLHDGLFMPVIHAEAMSVIHARYSCSDEAAAISPVMYSRVRLFDAFERMLIAFLKWPGTLPLPLYVTVISPRSPGLTGVLV